LAALHRNVVGAAEFYGGTTGSAVGLAGRHTGSRRLRWRWQDGLCGMEAVDRLLVRHYVFYWCMQSAILWSEFRCACPGRLRWRRENGYSSMATFQRQL